MMKLLSLEILIPMYKRPKLALRAAQSVVDQLSSFECPIRVTVTIQDDATPDLSDDQSARLFDGLGPAVVIRRNSVNLGMSANIYSMVQGSSADYCTILTDDDYLQPGALNELTSFIASLSLPGAVAPSAFFTPRYSYLENGSLHCVACRSFLSDQTITAGPESSLLHCHAGFILTGLFFRPALIDFQLWERHGDNAFFPVIYFARLLSCGPVMFLDRNWFHHTVMNECHWERWGATEYLRQARLFTDFLLADEVALTASLREVRGFRRSLRLRILGSENYYSSLCQSPRFGWRHFMFIPAHLWLQPAFLTAYLRVLGWRLRVKATLITSRWRPGILR